MEGNALTSYLPRQLLQRTIGDAPQQANEARFQGAVLFADISGSTRLAENLCDMGPEGVERLRAVLRHAFSRYVDCVQLFGGEIACFAGDALIAYWASDRHGLDWVTERAASCAKALQSLATSDPSVQETTPDLHIGIGAGDLWGARLGGIDGGWKLILAGSAVREAARSEADAPAGKIAFGPTAASMVEKPGASEKALGLASPDVSKASQQEYRAPDESELRTVIEAVVPRIVRERYAETGANWSGELRRVSVLFIRIEGLDEQGDNSLARHQEMLCSLLEAIKPYTGSTGNLVLDDKGLIFKLILGLPLDAYPDDVSRTISAGLAVGASLESQGLRWSGGIAAGRAFCGVIGGAGRYEYVATGIPLPVAARLMQSAADGLLCTREAAESADDSQFRFAPNDTLTLEGFRNPVDTRRVLGCTLPDSGNPRLLGRERESSVLHDQLLRVEHGDVSVAWIIGEAGTGKTSLVRKFLQDLSGHQVLALIGGASSGEYASSYVAWHDIFSALFDMEPGGTPAKNAETIRNCRLISDDQQDCIPLLAALLPLDIEETTYSGALRGELRVSATLNLLIDVLRLACVHRPMVIVLEDCHWMDSVSWRLVEMASRLVGRLMLVMTSRPVPETTELQSIRQSEHFTDINLGPLEKSAIAELIRNQLDFRSVSEDLTSRIDRRSQGNPFFAKAYVSFLRSANAITYVDQCWSLSTEYVETDTNVPTTVENLITSRIDGLTIDESALLRAASVIGRTFSLELLDASSSVRLASGDFMMLMRRLEEHQLVKALNEDGSVFLFVHDLIREVVYDHIPYSERRELHRSVAQSMEADSKFDTPSIYLELAHHWTEGDVPELAVEYSTRAAARALQSGAYKESEKLLQRCINLTERQRRVPADPMQLVRWHRQLGDALHGLGDQEGRAIEAHRALMLAGRPRPQSIVGMLAKSLWRLGALRVRRFASTLPNSQEGEAERTREILKSYRHSAYAGYFLNNPIAALYDSINAVDCAERLPLSEDLAGAYADLGGFVGVAGLRHIGWSLLDQAIDVAQRVGGSSGLAHVHMINGLFSVGMASWPRVESSVKQCQAYSEVLGDDVRWSTAQIVRFWSQYYQGDLAQAVESATLLHQRAKEAGNRQQELWGLRAEAICGLRAGATEDAVVRLETCMQTHRKSQLLSERLETQALLALGYLRAGYWSEAWTLLTESLDSARQAKRPINHALLESYSSLCEVAFGMSEEGPEGASIRMIAHSSLAELNRYQRFFPIGRPSYRYWRGRYEMLKGRGSSALRQWGAGLVEAERMGMARESGLLSEAISQERRHKQTARAA